MEAHEEIEHELVHYFQYILTEIVPFRAQAIEEVKYHTPKILTIEHHASLVKVISLKEM